MHIKFDTAPTPWTADTGIARCGAALCTVCSRVNRR